MGWKWDQLDIVTDIIYSFILKDGICEITRQLSIENTGQGKGRGHSSSKRSMSL
jgi:hypothetical protein